MRSARRTQAAQIALLIGGEGMPLIRSVSGVRGIIDPHCGVPVTLTLEAAADLGRAFTTYLRRLGGPRGSTRPRLLISRDGRPGGESLVAAVADGVRDCGAEPVPLGVVSTPGTALAVAEFAASLGVIGGVVVTASHNPQMWNGIKFLLPSGSAPDGPAAAAIFDLCDRRDFERASADRNADLWTGGQARLPDVHGLHVERVLSRIRPDAVRPRRFRVILDSVNGAGGIAGRLLLDRLGCEVTHLHDRPDAGFPHPPEPTEANLRGFCEQVAAGEYDVGFAQDPDADRLAIIDETGRYIGEEYTLALAAKHVFAVRPGPAVANLSTSRLIDDLAAAAGPPCVVHRSPVGEANVVQAMRRVGAEIGGEGNGGVIDPGVVLVRDSLVGMAMTLQLLADEGRPLSRIVDDLPRYAMVKDKLEADPARVRHILDAVAERFAGQRINREDGLRIDWPDSWVHVRGSNTEPILRIIAEARERDQAMALIARVREVVEQIDAKQG